MAVILLCLFFAVPWVGLQVLIVAFPGHIHLLRCSHLTKLSFLATRLVVLFKLSSGRHAAVIVLLLFIAVS